MRNLSGWRNAGAKNKSVRARIAHTGFSVFDRFTELVKSMVSLSVKTDSANAGWQYDNLLPIRFV